MQSARFGFTLVELLVVITIIGILAGLALPALLGAVERSRNATRKFEVTSVADAVEKYYQEYGDYPPDGSDLGVLQRHMRKLFPRMASPDSSLLVNLTHVSGSFSPVAMDRAEALVFFLGGFSKDLTHPITGPGGPLEFKNYLGDNDKTNIANYQYNMNRENGHFEIDAARLDVELTASNGYRSSDEVRYKYSGTALSSRGGVDLLPTYLAKGGKTPLVYFDSRTYGDLGSGVYNGYLIGSEYGGVRPYKTQTGAEPPAGATYSTVPDAFAAVKFLNANKFQIIHPGADGIYGAALVDSSGSASPLPIHFIAETGEAVVPNAGAASVNELKNIPTSGSPVTISRFSDSDWDTQIPVNGHLDNITNFSTSTLESDLP